jgi:hypothetical protein
LRKVYSKWIFPTHLSLEILRKIHAVTIAVEGTLAKLTGPRSGVLAIAPP